MEIEQVLYHNRKLLESSDIMVLLIYQTEYEQLITGITPIQSR